LIKDASQKLLRKNALAQKIFKAFAKKFLKNKGVQNKLEKTNLE